MNFTEPNRTRAWAPKSKTGCLGCKARKVRCDEGRPRCKSCAKRNIDCIYVALKTWVFEVNTPQPPARESNSKEALALCSPVITPWGSPEETRALQFFVERVAPWLDNQQPTERGALWSSAVPRTAANMPGIKHLMTAVALIEMPLQDATPFNVRQHSQAILRSYTNGLRELRRPHLSGPESAIGPLLAWVIELYNLHHIRAQMHIRGARVLHARALREGTTTVATDDFVHDRRFEDLLAHMSMWHTMRARLTPYAYPEPSRITNPASATHFNTMTSATWIPVEHGLVLALMAINMDIKPVHSSQVRDAFAHYFSHLHKPSMTADELSDARFYIVSWERVISQNKYRTPQASAVFNALYLLCGLAVALLPIPFPAKGEDGADALEDSLAHVLDRCGWLLGLKFGPAKTGVERGDEHDQEEMVKTVGLVLRIVKWFAPLDAAKNEAGRLLLEMGVVFDVRVEEEGNRTSTQA